MAERRAGMRNVEEVLIYFHICASRCRRNMFTEVLLFFYRCIRCQNFNWSRKNVNNNKIMKMIVTICSVGQKPMSTFRNPARVKLERWVLSRWTYSCIVPGHHGELIQLNMNSWIYNCGKLIRLNICTKDLICNAKEKYAHTIICLTILQDNMRKKWFDKLCTKIICRKKYIYH